MNEKFLELLQNVAPSLELPSKTRDNFAVLMNTSKFENQQQTNNVFSEKWNRYSNSEEKERLYEFQRQWYLRLYGFPDENALAAHLQSCKVVVDAGCGLGYKSAWFSSLAPDTLVIGIDFSNAASLAATTYKDHPNLFFIQGDISSTGFKSNSIQYVSCDQVIMHTEDPEKTFSELARITSSANGELACYFYAKKALPRELLDDYFRNECANLTNDELWSMSEQLTELGRRLAEIQISIDVPTIPALGIKGGPMDIQRFLYWNFLKCFWNSELGAEASIMTNFDWYSPSNARRFSEYEVRQIVSHNNLLVTHFHAEEACFSGRFVKCSQ